MEWQNLRPARARAARLAFLTCALAALALSAPLAQRLAPGASAQGERFGGSGSSSTEPTRGRPR